MRLSPCEVARRAADLAAHLSPCRLCSHACGVNRLAGELGRCGVGPRPKVASFGPHFGEESVLVGTHGSGTVFFSGCNLSCVFCQNYATSQLRVGTEIGTDELAEIFLELDRRGCHNLNLVTPTHQAPAIVTALARAREGGFDRPVVWNCGGYESVEVLRLLEGIVDIYMPDAKYADDDVAQRYSGAPGYATNLSAVLAEMHRQVGDLMIERGVARSGLLVRHLVLPNGLAGSDRVLETIAATLGPNTYVNVMDQYRPVYRAGEFPELCRCPTETEIKEAFAAARSSGLTRGLEEE